MNCKIVQENIDRQVFSNTIDFQDEINIHVDVCDECREHYGDAMKKKQMVNVIKKDPVLQSKDNMYSSIMSEIEITDQVLKQHNIAIRHKVYRYLQLTLAAASVTLLIVFGVEQYYVVNKIVDMEGSISVGNNINNTSIKNIFRFNAGQIDLSSMSDFKNESRKKKRSGLKKNIRFARLLSLSGNFEPNAKRLAFLSTSITKNK